MNVPSAEQVKQPIEEFGMADYAGEGCMFLGAGAAVLLQMSEPGVGRGVAEHSTILRRPLERLRTTMSYVYAVTLGSDEERHYVATMTNKAHVPIRSNTYSAFDPELQLWVAATLYKNGFSLYERFLGALDEQDAERIYQQAAVLGTALQVKPEMWPSTRADFERYWQHKVDTLTADDQVRDFVHDLLHGAESPLPIRIVMPLNRFITTGLLPERVREQLALPWGARRQRAFDLVMSVLPPLYRIIPRRVRWLPATYYLWDLRRRMRAGQGIMQPRR